MTDQRLRRLEREVAASPSPESEAALLRERLRSGTLSLERLELAAYAGHRPAQSAMSWTCPHIQIMPDGLFTHHADDPKGRRATEDCDPEITCSPEPLAAWVSSLSRWGPTVQVRAAVAAARVAKREHDAHCLEHGGEACPERCWRWGAAVDAADRWLAEPSEENRLDCRRLHDGSIGTTSGPWRFVLSLVCVAGDPRGHAPDALESDAHNAQILSVSLAGEAPVRAAIQSALISWALGSKG